MLAIASRFSLPAVLASAALALAGCASPRVDEPVAQTPPPQTDPTAPPVDLSQPALVGLLVPLSASDSGAAELGEAMVNAARLALADSGQAGMRLEV